MSLRYWTVWLWHRVLIGLGLLGVTIVGIIPIRLLNALVPLPDFMYLVGFIVSLLIVLAKVDFNSFVEHLKARERDLRSDVPPKGG